MRYLSVKTLSGLVILCLLASCSSSRMQRGGFLFKKGKKGAPLTTVADSTKAKKPAPPKTGPKPFSEVITAKAKENKGLFNVYAQDNKYFFEIPDSLLQRDLLVVNRIAKSGADLQAGFIGYGGDQVNQNVIRFEKGPEDKIFLREISYSVISKDSTQPMYQSVMNSNIQPIVAAFDIKAYSKDSAGSVIDLTDFINSDNEVLYFDPRYKQALKLGGLQTDKSYIESVHSYPVNTEIRTVKTYSKSGGPSLPGMPPAAGGGNATLELNTSIVLLPKSPMQPRYFDPRVGYFTSSYTDFDANPDGIKKIQMIARWRLEPRPEDMEKYKRGELVEPQKPIVFYIDPATPKKWVPYLIQGVNDWQKAFEQAGFKNAIFARIAPTKEQDSTWSLEDARYSAIVYKASDVANASGPHVSDPRSGEIMESHINWYHNVMELLRNWYFVQCSPNDPRARHPQFSDELMGQLIRFVSSHEVGHTLGLRHNFGSSSAYPVEKLRDKEWVKENGFAPSIMDYARFDYVAQPGDGITDSLLYPKINFYDKWAIEWGYKLIPEAKTADEETPVLNKWVMAHAGDKRYWFGTESNPDDPRSQSEDLGDNAMLASYYGIKNLQYIMPNLISWTREPDKDYSTTQELYNEIFSQYGRYMGHVVKNVGGIYETPKTVEQAGDVYAFVPKNIQHDAVIFLNKNLFREPTWLLDYNILNKFTDNGATEKIRSLQESILRRMLNVSKLTNLGNGELINGSRAYGMNDLFRDLNSGIWTELSSGSKIDLFRRNLQKTYVEILIDLEKPPSITTIVLSPSSRVALSLLSGNKSDVQSVVRGNLVALRNRIRAAIPRMADQMSKYHLQDLADRITRTLEPK